MNKQVRFEALNEVVTYTPKSVNARKLWYTKEEYDFIKQECKTEMRKCGYVARGLELIQTDDSWDCCRNVHAYQKKHMRNVLALQDDHNDHGLKDETGLKTFSQALSKEALKQAQQRAAQDSILAFNIHIKTSASTPFFEMKAATAEEYAKKTRRSSFSALGRPLKARGSQRKQRRTCKW